MHEPQPGRALFGREAVTPAPLFTSGHPADSFDRLARGPRAAVLEEPFSAMDLVEGVRRSLDA